MPTDGATRRTIPSSATPATSACQKTGRQLGRPQRQRTILTAAQTATGQKQQDHADGPRHVGDRHADQDEDGRRERARKRPDRPLPQERLGQSPGDPEHSRGDDDREGEVSPEADSAEEPAEEDEERHRDQEEQDRETPAGHDSPVAGSREERARATVQLRELGAELPECAALFTHGRPEFGSEKMAPS